MGGLRRPASSSVFNDLMGVVGTVQKVFYSDGKTFPSADNELNFKQRTNVQLLLPGRLAHHPAPDPEPRRAL
jgi:hypothetical protein